MQNDVNKHSTIDYIYEKLKENIIELTYAPSEQLVETSLAKMHGVSRTPLRHALYRLEIEGLVTKKTNGRLIVSPMSIQEAQELYRVREMLEGLIAREATINMAKMDQFESIINKMEDITYLMRKATDDHRKTDIVYYGTEFHLLLQKYSNDSTAVNFLQQINSRVARYRRLGAYKDPTYPSVKPVEEHERVIAEIKKKDEIAAELAMRNHIKRSLQNTISAIDFL